MSYRLETNEPLGIGLKRIAREQIDQALEQLTTAPEGRDEAVHDARKRFKKIRAILRLVRDEIGQKVYKRENVCYRDAGRRLSDIRDSYVMIETLDSLADELDANVYDELRDKLLAEYEALKRQMLDHDEAMAEVAATIKKARRRVKQWPIKHNDFSAISAGLKRVYKRGRKGLSQAYANPKPENFHDWRKRVKYLWYHTRLLENMWPGLLDGLIEQTHTLADVLGDDHDLAELRHLLLTHPELFNRERDMEDLVELITRRQAELKETARHLGELIYAERPKAFVKRMAQYWQV
ncbi:MAG: CHAD domain-containing protein [Anaerolineae bacterium]|nr:CHAD domain-containing protein [Anaerolineae bacterium]